MYRVAKLYNMLPVDIKEVEKYELFKTRVRFWIKKKISIKP